MKDIKVTILMPVYNGEKYLKEAIDSILSQTFKNFDFLIINDGSTDNSENIIKSYNDTRIKYLKNIKNLGIVETLNMGLSQIKTEYIARMDCDDISLPTRLEKQILFMENNKKVAVVGTWISYIGEVEEEHYPTNTEFIESKMLLGNQIAHPSVIIRTNVLNKYKIKYSNKYKYANDYDLWVTIIKNKLKILNIPEVLLDYRIHPNQMSQDYPNREREITKIQKEYFLYLFSSFKFIKPVYLINIIKYTILKIFNIIKLCYKK